MIGSQILSGVLGALLPLASVPAGDVGQLDRTIEVSTSAQLASALGSAAAGDTIVVANGSYTIGKVSSRHGTESAPIVVRAANRGQAVISGGQLEVVTSSYVVFEGLRWTNSNTLKVTSSHHVRLTRNHFRLTEPDSSLKWVLIQGADSHHNRIDHNLFEQKNKLGNFITIDGSETQQSQDDRIDHNHFRNTGPRAANEKEAIRVGWSEISRSNGRTVIEHNLFENCDGDPEIVSVKSNDNIVRYNTFRTSMGVLSARHGNRNSFYGNVFLGGGKAGTGGIRVYGQDHKIYNNYLEGLTGTGYDAPLQLDGGDVDQSGALSSHFRVYRATVAFNTFVNNVSGIEIGKNYTHAPVDSVIANNVVVGSQGKLFSEFKTPVDLTYVGNLAHPTGSATVGLSKPAEQIRIVDPQLVREGELLKLSPSSPAIDAATGADLAYVTDDVEGQPRADKDVGADERSNATATRRPLTPSDVGVDGPEDGGGPPPPVDTPLPVTAVLASADDGNVAANTLDDNLATRWSASGTGAWIRYDLGQSRTVSKMSITWHKGDQRIAHFQVQLSADASTWQTLATLDSSGTTAQPESYDLPDTSARYVRIVGNGNSVNEWNSITETDIFGPA